MMSEQQEFPVGMPVIALNGEMLGTVREAHEHYILIDQAGVHEDLRLPVDAIAEMMDGKLHVSVNREALNAVDHEETVHRHEVDE
jgi:hypothetical protein